MNPLLLAPLLEFGKDLIGRFFPDKEEARKAEAEFLRLAMDGELKQVIAQLQINAQEAAHPSMWVAGWRPAFGWVGGAGFLYAVLLQPLLAWAAAIKGWPVPPVLDTDLLLTVAGGMLGIGGLRTYERAKGVIPKGR
ncbi:MAG: holin family protein [Pseudohongiellaceae bacterium]